MPTFLALVSEGTWIKKAFVAPPWHPTTGPWGNLHSTSYPNVVQLAGTLFITPDTQFIQEAWLPRRPTRGAPAGITAHAKNSTAYASLNRGFHHTYMQRGPDKDVVDWAVDLLRRTDVRFMRIHLQNTGEAGRVGSGDETKDVPWRQNIWADGSPYRIAALEADRQLARFVAALRAIGKWEGTVLLVISDHGQADQGWHAPLSEGAWSTPMLWIGPRIATGRVLDYGEHTDVAPMLAQKCRCDAKAFSEDCGHVRLRREPACNCNIGQMRVSADDRAARRRDSTIHDVVMWRLADGGPESAIEKA
nr:sulfatase-like hydrolase/transferase [Rhodomicrobium vannielii]